MRVGVDIGGTFTKAVAVDGTGQVVARAVVPTSHDSTDGVAAGVVDAVARLAGELGAGEISLVTHSTTQAVNALLEGDVAMVGVVGMGREPNLAKARRRTNLGPVEMGDGRSLQTVTEFLDVSRGLDLDAVRAALERLVEAGAGAVAVAEAFAPDDTANEQAVANLASGMGLPTTTSAELSGLYGLELRTVTAAVNSSILPVALRTADVVRDGVAACGIAAPVMVMRGDGGATDLEGFLRAPARTLYSGPAASVAGALRTHRVDEGVIVEVGGTSTNIAAIKAGQPALSYVQVAGRPTAIRALDVAVAGVAGGSMLRSRRRRVYGVGPRSAHIAGLAYCCFLPAADMVGADATCVSPRPGDPPDYVVLRLSDGRQAALTNTCAANALGLVEVDDYAYGNPEAARAGFAAAGAMLRLPGDEVARRMLQASCMLLGDLVSAAVKAHDLKSPEIVAVGGGAGALGRQVAAALGLPCTVPDGAEVISSVGDALSLVRAERERTVQSPGPEAIRALVEEVQAEALAAGAAPASLDVRVTHVSERGAIRVVATGALALHAGAVPGRPAIGADEALALVRARGCDEVLAVGACWLGRSARRDKGRVVILDRFGDLVVDLRGEAVTGQAAGADLGRAAADLVTRHVRHMGPVTVAPSVWVVHGAQVTELADTEPAAVAGTVTAMADGEALVAVAAGRS
ncbi:MAG: hydantoinase/oxoprolinase family protein [Acidimicrobiales bacterium]